MLGGELEALPCAPVDQTQTEKQVRAPEVLGEVFRTTFSAGFLAPIVVAAALVAITPMAEAKKSKPRAQKVDPPPIWWTVCLCGHLPFVMIPLFELVWADQPVCRVPALGVVKGADVVVDGQPGPVPCRP